MSSLEGFLRRLALYIALTRSRSPTARAIVMVSVKAVAYFA